MKKKSINQNTISTIIITIATTLIIGALGNTAQGSFLTVTNTSDSGAGSLRQAIADAAAGDTIVFASPAFDVPTVINTTSEITINKNLTITGKGADLLTVKAFRNRVFQVSSGNVNLSGMTITGTSLTGSTGGAILNLSPATLTLLSVNVTGNTSTAFCAGIRNIGTLNVHNSTISNNTLNDSSGAGGILNAGTLRIINSTISGNRAVSGGIGGVGAFGTSVLILNSTITDNETSGGTGGVGVDSIQVTVRNSIIAGNCTRTVNALCSNSTTPDVSGNPPFGNFVSNGNNLIGNVGAVTTFNQTGDQTGNGATPLDPLLFPLGNYGGGVPTHALRRFPVASPAIDKGSDASAVSSIVATDARGLARPFNDSAIAPTSNGNNSDIGAFEYLPYVSNLQNSGQGSLRDAFSSVPAGAYVIFDPDVFGNSMFPLTTSREINLSGGQITIDKNISLVGTTPATLTIRNLVAGSRVFFVSFPAGGGSGANANFSGMTITSGNITSSDGGGIRNIGNLVSLRFVHITGINAGFSPGGGGIENEGSGFNIYNSTISGNSALQGGGIFSNSGTIRIINSTISGNHAGQGGGILLGNNAFILSSMITNNEADGAGSAGGIHRVGGTITTQNSIIADNCVGTAVCNNSTTPDVVGSGFVSNGNNLIGNVGAVTTFNQTGDQTGIGASPLAAALAPLGNYGGLTPTHALFSSSPAIDPALSNSGVAADQRGANRIGTADVGAVELNSSTNGGDFVAVLPNGNIGQNYSQNIFQDTGAASCFLQSGELPPGINLTTSFAANLSDKEEMKNSFSPAAVVSLTGTPTVAGTYYFVIRTTSGANVVDTNYQMLIPQGPTAATTTVGGRVLTTQGNGIRNAFVMLIDSNGNARTVKTGTFGYYSFSNVEVGQTYTISVASKRFQFATRVISLSSEITDVDFIAQ